MENKLNEIYLEESRIQNTVKVYQKRVKTYVCGFYLGIMPQQIGVFKQNIEYGLIFKPKEGINLSINNLKDIISAMENK